MSLARKWRQGVPADELNRRPMVFVDIGARFGLPPHWAAVAPLLDIVAFEPDVVEARRLENYFRKAGATVGVVPSAVWDAAGRQTLHITRDPGCSSLYQPRTEFLMEFPDAERFDIVSRVEVETCRLDSLMSDPAERPFRFVKIDAQGGAFPILSGAKQVLDTAIGIEVEAELAPMYQGEQLLGDIDRLLRSSGFELVDLRPTYWRRKAARDVAGTRGQLIFVDALYMLSPRNFASRLATQDGASADHLNASALLICDVYGIADWMVAYVDASRDLSARQLKLLVPPPLASGKPASRLRYRLGQWLKDVGDSLIESRDAWAVAEQRLGNKSRLRVSLSEWLARNLRLK